jgi:hypothetical protein
MTADLEAQGRAFESFVVHDVKRTVRTKLSALPIEGTVRERLLAHIPSGLRRIYDLHLHEREKREGLEMWHTRLRAIGSRSHPVNFVGFDRF